jgi:hypothetical protein
MRRRATIALHWTNAALLMVLLAAGAEAVVLAWLYAATALGMVGLALVFGLMNGPGPKLEGTFRMAQPWMNRALYGLLAWSAVVVGTDAIGSPLPGPGARSALLSVLAAAMIHAVFNLWRHTALCDGALRRITPRALHNIL